MRKACPTVFPEGVALGARVMYYVNGWRYGTLESVKGQIAKIKPLAGNHRAYTVPMEDVKKSV